MEKPAVTSGDNADIAEPESAAASVVARLAADAVPARELLDRLSDNLDPDQAVVSAHETSSGRWSVDIHFLSAPNETAVRALVALAAGAEAANALTFERIAATDWVKASLDGLPPVTAGRFVVHGAHDRARIAPNRIGIEIEAALAFGTGHHGTTRGCLLALDELTKRITKPATKPVTKPRHPEVPAPLRGPRRMHGPGRRPSRAAQARPPQGDGSHRSIGGQRRRSRLHVLDLGTGSGVLGIAAVRALHAAVLASDIDPQCVQVARENAKANRAASITVIRAVGCSARRIRDLAPFDLVLANILLGPLQKLATPMARLLAPGAHVVLSGLLTAHANAALAAYRAQGLALERRVVLEGWATLVLRRPTK